MSADWIAVGYQVLTWTLLVFVISGAMPVITTLVIFLAIPFHGSLNNYAKSAPYLPRVAVLVPAWNEEAVIGATVDRFMTLEYPRDRLRVYVVDDASTDATPQVVEDRAARYPGSVFHLRRAHGGEGKAHTLNHGLRIVLADDWAEAVLITDADVIYTPDSLRKLTRHLADPEVGAVTAYVREGSIRKNYLTRFIAIEYVLSQVAARRAQNVLGAQACLAGGAQAACRTSSGTFRPAQNDSVTWSTQTDGVCDHRFTSFSDMAFTSASVVQPPRNGRLSKTGNFSFRYQARPGFKGADTYAVKVCASGRSGSGCSTITYQTTVN